MLATKNDVKNQPWKDYNILYESVLYESFMRECHRLRRRTDAPHLAYQLVTYKNMNHIYKIFWTVIKVHLRVTVTHSSRDEKKKNKETQIEKKNYICIWRSTWV